MYTLHLDLEISFCPPMSDHGRGIVMTRTLQMPFPPSKGLRVFSKEIDECPLPDGMGLSDVVWDMDRRVFLAVTRISNTGEEIPDIPRILRAWLDRGWEFGSFRDSYEPTPEPETSAESPRRRRGRKVPRASKRVKRIGQAHKALIRFMVESYNDPAAAYAMDRTGLYYTQREIDMARAGSEMDDEKRAYSAAYESYLKMRDSRVREWEDGVIARHPDLLELARKAEPY